MTIIRRLAAAFPIIVGAITGVAGVRLFGVRQSGGVSHESFGAEIGRGEPQMPVSATSVANGFEDQDVNARELSWTMLIFAVSAMTAVALMVLATRRWHHQDAARETGFTYVQRHQSEPPLPHLQANPIGEIDALREREARKLRTYAKLDPTKAQIPIERAMKLVTGQSLDANAAPERKP